MNWEATKETLLLWYGRVAQFFLFQNFILYLVACIAAGQPLGPGRYVEFVHHLFLFH